MTKGKQKQAIIELVLEEAIEGIDGEKSTGGAIMPSSDHSDDDLEAEDEIPARPLLSYHDAVEYIEDLRQYVEAKCPGSIGHMEQVERDIRRERILSRQKTSSQPCINSLQGRKLMPIRRFFIMIMGIRITTRMTYPSPLLQFKTCNLSRGLETNTY